MAGTMDLNGRMVVLLGGSGMIGGRLAQALLERGARVRIVSRRVERAYRLKPLGNLGQIEFARCDITDRASLARALAGAGAVVNLVGAFAGDLDAVQGRGAGAIAAAAGAAGAEALVHFSAIGADPAGATAYARSKAAGEAAVHAAFPGATILRPSVVFGPDDAFINRFANLIAMFKVFPVFAPAARLQPVFVDDVVEAAVRALIEPARFGGQTFELAGPEVLTMLQLNRMIAAAAHRDPLLVALPDTVAGGIASLTGWLPGAPITRDQWLMLKAGNVASGARPGLGELGVTARPLGLFLDRWLVRFRPHGRFGG